jgi:hypothetical protein
MVNILSRESKREKSSNTPSHFLIKIFLFYGYCVGEKVGFCVHRVDFIFNMERVRFVRRKEKESEQFWRHRALRGLRRRRTFAILKRTRLPPPSLKAVQVDFRLVLLFHLA